MSLIDEKPHRWFAFAVLLIPVLSVQWPAKTENAADAVGLELQKDSFCSLEWSITEFKWNGTDMYGQRLANGVYLYHVVTNLNGKSLEKYKASGDNTDKYFNNGYGKMYLMR